MNPGLIIATPRTSWEKFQDYLALFPSCMLITLDNQEDFTKLPEFFERVAGEIPIFPMFRLGSRSAFELADVIYSTMRILAWPSAIYLWVHESRDILNYLNALSYRLSQKIGQNGGKTKFYICAPASDWLTKSSPAQMALNYLDKFAGGTSPGVMLSDTYESELAWEKKDFARFLQEKEAHILVTLLDADRIPDFQRLLSVERPVFFWSVSGYLEYQKLQAKPVVGIGTIALAEALVDKASAWDTPSLNGHAVRKFKRGERVELVQIFPGARGGRVGKTQAGDYILLSHFSLEEL